MDPYIEACGLWEDFHNKLIGEIERALAPQLPEHYLVRAGERAYVVLVPETGVEERSILPDLGIVRRRPARKQRKRGSATDSGPAVLEAPEHAPAIMRALVDTEFRETFLEIREAKPQHRLITTIEVLSPSNKRMDSPGWIQYSRKRQSLLTGYANLVEIDLLRGGQRMPMEDDWPDAPYYLLVAHKEEAPRCRVWPAHFLRPLPELVVPLSRPDRDISLRLQPLIAAVYERSRYEVDIDYRQPLRPALKAQETARVRELMRGRHK
jgi:hypothetical protein